jgi:acyl-coenzyme A thioesterase PaaI-like protein
VNELADLVDDGYCIGCGPHSQIGLRMQFETTADGSVESRIVLPRSYQGWRDIAHGGVVALLLDEAMAYAAAASGVLGVTAELKLRFRNAAPTGTPLVVRANVVWRRGDVLATSATLGDGSGTEFASAEGRFIARGTLAAGQRFGTLDGR